MANKILSEEAANAVFARKELGKADRGKVRFLAGWVVHKVQAAAHWYIEKNNGTSNISVKENIVKERHVLQLLKRFGVSREEALRCTSYPETLEHIEFHNRGALQHVSDSVFLFFVELERNCQEIFTAETISKYQREGLKVARRMVINSCKVKVAWENLMVSIAHDEVAG